MNTHHDTLVSMLTEHSQALALPMGRRVGQPGHDLARDYLLRQMADMRLVPFVGDSFELSYERPHPNTRQPQRFTNLIGVIPGTEPHPAAHPHRRALRQRDRRALRG